MGASNKNTLLVPVDLTYVANRAVKHSVEIAKQFNLKVCLLHILAKKATYSEHKKVESQLQTISDFTIKHSGIDVSYMAKEGNIFDGISHAADEISAELIIMGVHNKRGEVDILGSFAYNVVKNSKVPVMIVNKDNIDISDNHIIVPVDYLKIQSKIKANIAVKYAKQLNCPVYVTGDVYYESSEIKKATGKTKVEKERFLKEIAEYIEKTGVTVKSGMKVRPKTILVPTDFTANAERAFEHAIAIAKAFDRNICLLHVVSETITKAEKEKINNTLKTISQTHSKNAGVDITYRLKEGSIFDVIPATVSEISAGFVVMGYHGKKSIKNLAGGFAYSVISSSRVPVMIVKKENKKISDNTIVVPIDFSYEKLKKIDKATKIAQHFDCHVHVIIVLDKEVKMPTCDKSKLLERVNSDLEEDGIKYNTEIIEKPKAVLVPVDFTEAAGCALTQAHEIAKLFSRKLVLLHIVGKKITPSEEKEVEEKLKDFSKNYIKQNSIEVNYKIKTGSIFNVITDTALEVSAEFIVMGIHGKKGLQHIIGSFAYKVIISSKVPIIVFRKECHPRAFKNIVVSVDFSDESRVKVSTAIRFAKYFDSKLHIIGVISSKSSALRLKQEVLLKNLTHHVESSGIDAKTEILTDSGVGVYKKVLEYAKNVNSDLLMIIAKKEGIIAEVFGSNYAKKIIENADIPVLTTTTYYEEEKEPEDIYSVGYFIDPFGLTR